jgi:hypothetical protein
MRTIRQRRRRARSDNLARREGERSASPPEQETVIARNEEAPHNFGHASAAFFCLSQSSRMGFDVASVDFPTSASRLNCQLVDVVIMCEWNLVLRNELIAQTHAAWHVKSNYSYCTYVNILKGFRKYYTVLYS